jgi:hypothetical protein
MLTDIVNRTDVGVVQSRSSPRLALEAVESLGIPSDLVRKKLESYETLEPGVLGLVDHAHPAAAQLLDNAVMGNDPADRQIAALLPIFVPLAAERSRGHFYRRALQETSCLLLRGQQ